MVEYFEIGLISNTHGLKGELKVRPYTENAKRFEEIKKVLIKKDDKNFDEYEVQSVRYQKDIVLLKLKEIEDIDQAERLKGQNLIIPREDAKELEQNEFFIADLIGCDVYVKDEQIGKLIDVFTAGASDVYVVKREGKKELLLPALESVVKNIDLENKKIEVEIPRGLEDEV
ncbi:MAG: 16S rRNA processing protein RimM [Clostridia bacterium]|nr:16S rRNA processing protein RimM [Clostridia bacterium]